MECLLYKTITNVLWDTGVQVSLVSRVWLEQFLPEVKTEPVSKILQSESLVLGMANSSELQYHGYVEHTFQLAGSDNSFEVLVPILVTLEELPVQSLVSM